MKEEGESLKADKRKLELAMARACMNAADLVEKAELPRPTVNNVIVGRNVRTGTVGRIAKALGVDVTEIIETED